MSDSKLMQAFFDSCDAGFYVKDAEGHFLLVNRKGAAWLGLSEAECVGKTAFDVVPKEDAEFATKKDREVIDSATAANFVATVNLPSGPRKLLDHKFPMSGDGHAGAVAGVVIDVTDQGQNL